MSVCFTDVPKVVSALGVRVIAGFCLAVGVGAGAAYAQDCGCVVPLSNLPSGQAIGQLTSASGPVNVLGGNGWVSASTGTPLFVGSQIETGAGASASLAVGGCSLSVGAQSAASLIPTNQSLCVSVTNTAPGANPAGNAAAGGAPVNNPTMMGIAGGIGAAAGIIAVTTGDVAPASP